MTDTEIKQVRSQTLEEAAAIVLSYLQSIKNADRVGHPSHIKAALLCVAAEINAAKEKP